MQTLNSIIFVVFTLLVVAGGLRTFMRYVEYRRAKRPVPILLIRDLISRNGLAISFILILAVRAGQWGELVREQLWWLLLTGVPALFGAATYAYFEFFVIDKVEHLPYERRRHDD